MVVSSVAATTEDLGVEWVESKDVQRSGSVEGTKAILTPSLLVPQQRKENHSFASPAVLSKN